MKKKRKLFKCGREQSFEISRKALTKKEMPCYNEEKKFRQPGGQDAYF